MALVRVPGRVSLPGFGGQIARPRGAPIPSIRSAPHGAAKAAVWPIPRRPGVTVLDRVAVDVFHVTAPIVFVANDVFPKARLPMPFSMRSDGYAVFDQPPAHGEIGIPRAVARWRAGGREES